MIDGIIGICKSFAISLYSLHILFPFFHQSIWLGADPNLYVVDPAETKHYSILIFLLTN